MPRQRAARNSGPVTFLADALVGGAAGGLVLVVVSGAQRILRTRVR